MATTHKKLASGQLATSTSLALYTTPSATTAFVKTILLHNTASSAVVAELYYDGTDDSDRFLKISLEADETLEYAIGHLMPLLTAEELYGKAATADVVNFFIFGATES